VLFVFFVSCCWSRFCVFLSLFLVVGVGKEGGGWGGGGGGGGGGGVSGDKIAAKSTPAAPMSAPQCVN